MIKKWVIYKIISPSGKIYIGKTSNFRKRLRHYQYGDYKRQTRLYSSFIKYGYDSHEIKILDEFESTNDFASGKEKFWIRSFMSNYCKYPQMNGLNLTDGGEGIAGFVMSEESRKKLSERIKANPINNKGWKMSEEQKAKQGERLRANPINYWKGKKRSEEDKRKMVENRRANGGYIVSEETKIKHSIALKGRKRNIWWDTNRKGKKMPAEAIEKMKETKRKNISLMTPEERKERFGKHLIGHTFNRGRKHKL